MAIPCCPQKLEVTWVKAGWSSCDDDDNNEYDDDYDYDYDDDDDDDDDGGGADDDDDGGGGHEKSSSVGRPPLGESSRFSTRQLLCHKHKHTAQTEYIKYWILNFKC